MDFPLLITKIVRRVGEVGLRSAFREAFGHLRAAHEADDFDVRHGTDTGRPEPLWKFAIRSPNRQFGRKYQATDEQELAGAVNFLHEDPRLFTFIDLGCGKGRTLLVAASLGFKQVIGVEFVGEFVEIAKSNLSKMQIANAVVVHADAARFQFPGTDMVVYLYNPFSQEVIRKVVANLRESGSKKIYVIYKVPESAEAFDSSGFLTRTGPAPAGRDIVIWRSVP